MNRDRERLQRILDGSLDLVLLLNNDGTVLEASAAAEWILGWRPTELAGSSVFALVPPDTRNDSRTRYPSLQRGELVVDFRHDVLHRDRSRVPMFWSAARMEDGQVVCIGRDATEREAAEAQISALQQRTQAIVECITDAFMSMDQYWRLVYVNPRAEVILEQPRADLIGQNIWEKFPGAVHSAFYHCCQRAVSCGEPVTFAESYPPLQKWLEVRAYPSAEGLSVLFQDISDRRRQEQALEHQATHDALTGLLNRRGCMLSAQQYVTQATQSGRGFALLFVDLDRFKQINDAYGHDAGDKALQWVSQRFTELLPDGVLGRFSGDEFLFLAPDHGLCEARSLARRALAAASLPVAVDGGEFVIGASVGIALYPQSATSAEELIKCADIAMYQGKPRRRRGSPRIPAGDGPAPACARAADARADVRDHARRTEPPLPAEVLAVRWPCVRRRGAGALAAPRAGIAGCRRIRTDGRGIQGDHRARELGAGGRLPATGLLVLRGAGPAHPEPERRRPAFRRGFIASPPAAAPESIRAAAGAALPGDHREHADAGRRYGAQNAP